MITQALSCSELLALNHLATLLTRVEDCGNESLQDLHLIWEFLRFSVTVDFVVALIALMGVVSLG